jgi:two-component system LytT family response regulator
MIESAIIIDDEIAAIENLQMMLSELSPRCQIHEANNILDAKEIIEKKMPKIIFLDINMPQHNGFDLFELIDPDKYIIVIVSAHLNYSLKAIKLKVFDFLLKPFGFTTLKNSLIRIENHLQSVQTIEKPRKKIVFKTRNELFYVDPFDIVYCESDNNYTTIFLKNQKKITLAKSIKSIEEELQYPHFFRVHRSYIINIQLISSYKISEDFLCLIDETIKIPVSDRKKKEFYDFINS